VKEVGIVTYMFLKFAGCGAKVATEEKKVIHGHQRGKSWTKEGVALYWVASTVSPTFWCFHADHAC
jgi:hypothetical protein